jgi:hypothetical protein
MKVRSVALATLLPCLVVAFLGLVPGLAHAGGGSAVLGEVSVGAPVSVDETAFRRNVSAEFARAFVGKRPSRAVVLSVSLVSLDTAGKSPACRVSAAIRDAKQGTIVAVAEGRAHTMVQGGDPAALVNAALKSALAQAAKMAP